MVFFSGQDRYDMKNILGHFGDYAFNPLNTAFIFYFYHPRKRGGNVFTMCVCVCLCLPRYLSGRFNWEGLVPHKQYFAGTFLVMSSCETYVSRTHEVSQIYKLIISPSIFELERRSKAQISEMLMALFLVCSTSGITSGQKVCNELEMAAILNF